MGLGPLLWTSPQILKCNVFVRFVVDFCATLLVTKALMERGGERGGCESLYEVILPISYG